MYLPKGAKEIQQDLQKPGGMALEAGTSGSCVSMKSPSSYFLLVCLPEERVVDFIETSFKPHHYEGKSHPSLLIPELGMTCSKYYRINGTNTSLTEQLELTEEHSGYLRSFLPGHQALWELRS